MSNIIEIKRDPKNSKGVRVPWDQLTPLEQEKALRTKAQSMLSAVNIRVQELEKENAELLAKNVVLLKEQQRDAQQKQGQYNIMNTAMTNNNKQVEDCVAEIQLLKTKLRKYEKVD